MLKIDKILFLAMGKWEGTTCAGSEGICREMPGFDHHNAHEAHDLIAKIT